NSGSLFAASPLATRPLGREMNRPMGTRQVHRGGEPWQSARVSLSRGPRPAYLGAGALAASGEFDRAKEWAARAIDPDDVLTQYNLACLHCLLGDFDRA